MTRRERWLPWLLAVLFGAALLMGVAWDASYEASPADTDNISQGATRIRSLKVETRDRIEEEHCFGSGGGSGCTGDSGFHREGSALAFVQNGTPAVLLNPAGTAVGEGRIWLDGDGPDAAPGTFDDNTILIHNGTAFQRMALGALSTVTLTAPIANDVLRFNGATWGDAQPLFMLIRDQATFEANETFTNAACAVDCTAVADIPDHVGGTDANNYPEVQLPVTTTQHDVVVTVNLQWRFASGDGDGVFCELEEDLNDANTFATTATAFAWSGNHANTQVNYCQLHYVRRNGGSGNRYAYRVRMGGVGGNEDWDVESTAAPAVLQATSFIRVEARPELIF